jgi:hypothetical protein
LIPEIYKPYKIERISYRFLPIQNFADTAVTYTKLSADDAGSDTSGSHFYDFQSYVVWKRATIDENSSELIHPPLA